MTMQASRPASSDLVEAQPDFDIRKGGGMTEERPAISWADYEEFSRTDPTKLRKYCMHYRESTKAGPGTGVVIAMPAEKHQKWFGQGYRPVGYVQSDPPPPRQWLPSMVEDAINEGLPVPEELAPLGYMGETFSLKELKAKQKGDPEPQFFRCSEEGCHRFFDSEAGQIQHERTHR